MWSWIKQAAASAWTAGKAWISKKENQQTAIEQGKKIVDGWGKK